MYKIKLLNKISPVGTSRFDMKRYAVGDDVENPDAILVRSASMHEMEVNANLRAVARAGAGVNNIPVDAYSEQGIVVFNTPGANANAVKELVIGGLMLASRNIAGAIEWAKGLAGNGAEIGKMVEKGKSAFAGPEIEGKTLGVIGLGAIGVMVANTAKSLGMTVYGYDPYLSVDAAWNLSRSIQHATDLKTIYEKCDYITLHVPANAETKGMINSESIGSMKNGVRILNFARGELVNNDDLRAALESGKVARYVTDFPCEATLAMPNTVNIPHLGASTPESEDNCARMAVDQMRDYLERGAIRNSVNFPNVDMPMECDVRLCIIHRNVPSMLSQISSLVANAEINIEHMVNKSKKDYAYTVLDILGEVPDSVVAALREVKDILRVTVLR
ncbi:MAG: phosphoglycerate dehydrogenase [Clostridia bacterium]|nr:phosphoglycerate dehydrogenase [Clostridia bacterium]